MRKNRIFEVVAKIFKETQENDLYNYSKDPIAFKEAYKDKLWERKLNREKFTIEKIGKYIVC